MPRTWSRRPCCGSFAGFDNFRGDDARAWLLTIVRNTCYTWLERQRNHEAFIDADADIDTVETDHADPLSVLSRNIETEQLRQAIEELPPEFREVIVLNEPSGADLS